MVSFSYFDIFIILLFFVILIAIGFFARTKEKDDYSEFLLSGRKVGLFLFVLTNVSTWYGGILGVGEFTYNSGILSWVTQGLPYYIFAIIFALFFAEKIRSASLFTIPDKLEQIYGKRVGTLASILIFILVTPAPYILMIGTLIQLIFGFNLFTSLIVAVILSTIYLMKGGYKSDLYTDAFQFFVMFIGFIMIVIFSFTEFGGITFLEKNLPQEHLQIFGSASPLYITVWFLIATWTFADPGFHQRCYAAKDGKTAKYGIIISVFLWAFFDFLTTTTGLFSKAVLPNIENPVLAFPLYAEKIMTHGLKGIFYIALFATIISTSNSFLFISATTFGRDLIYKLSRKKDQNKIIKNTRIGLIVASVLSVTLAYLINSVINIWYIVGSICIPGIILLVISSYYEKIKVSNEIAFIELIAASLSSFLWVLLREVYKYDLFINIEPMIIGLISASVIHLYGLSKLRFLFKSK